jgi:hypothetical protein
MNLNVIYVDYKDGKGKWQKDWHSLCYGKIVTLEDAIQNGGTRQADIQVVHRSNPGLLSCVDSEQLKSLQKNGHVMVVSTSNGIPVFSDDGFVCISGESFPGGAGALTHLQERFQLLVTRLSQCEDAPCRLNAWKEFHRCNVLNEFVISLSLLCQGFLAQYALNNRANGCVNTKLCADVGKALKVMGWVEDEVATEASPTVRDLGLNPAESLPEADFWRKPFEGEKSLRQGLVEECPVLREKVSSKIENKLLDWSEGATLPKRIDALVKAIENSQVAGGNFVCVVARAYLELNLLLEDA